MKTLHHLPALSILACCLVGCGKTQPDLHSVQHKTPQATFDAFRIASKANDMGTAARLLVPESQAMFAFGMVMEASFSTGADPEKEKSLEALFSRHGLNPNEDTPDDKLPASQSEMLTELVAPIKDIPAFLDELSAWIRQNDDSEDGGGLMELGELSDVSIDGDLATANVSTEMGKMPVTFQRVNSSWLLCLPTDGPRDSGQSVSGTEEQADNSSPEIGTLRIGDNVYRLRHSVAYSSRFFDDPCTVILLTSNLLRSRELDALKKSLREEGNDDDFHLWDAQVKLTFSEEGELIFLNAWADNVSINASTEHADAEFRNEGGRIVGKALMIVSQEESDSPHRIDVTFDAELIAADDR